MSELPQPRRSLLPVVLGFALAGILTLALGLWVARRPNTESYPSIELLNPTRDTLVSGPVTLRFRTSVPLKLQPTGWGAGRFHVHAMMDATELMPAATSIRPLSDRVYEWSIPAPVRAATLQLFWSLPNHTRISQGASRAVRINAQ